MLVALIGLWLLPVLGYLVSRRDAPGHRGLVTGACFGAVVSPASMGLYGLYFLGPIPGLIGLVALPVALFHGGPGYDLAIAFHLIPSGKIVQGEQHLWLWLIDGAIWALVYGAIGAIIDAIRRSRASSRHVRRAA